MFTGLVEALGEVVRVHREGAGRSLTVRVPPAWVAEIRAGDSVAVDGVCLTAVDVERDALRFDLADETVRVTTLGELQTGDPVNLERPLRLGMPVGGHLVLGHVDGVGRVAGIEPEGDGRRLTVSVPVPLRPLLIPKGSVAVDGVSLTIAGLDETTLSVALIPHTLAVTTLGRRQPGAGVNLEIDVIGKYVRAFLPGLAGSEARAFLGRQGLLAPTRKGGD
jgi:riboflavin synthase alpha subunit